MPISQKQDLIDPTFVALVTPHISNADPYDEDNLLSFSIGNESIRGWSWIAQADWQHRR